MSVEESGKERKTITTGKVPWHLVNWDIQDIEIAERFKCSRERVRQKRAELISSGDIKKSKPKRWHRRRGCARERIDAIPDTSDMSLDKISSIGKCSKSYALQCLKLPNGKMRSYTKVDLRGNTKYDWASADWTKGYKEIAADLGIENPGVVTQYRQRHGIKVSRITSADKIRKALDRAQERKEIRENALEELDAKCFVTDAGAAKVGECTERYAKEVIRQWTEAFNEAPQRDQEQSVSEDVEEVEERVMV